MNQSTRIRSPPQNETPATLETKDQSEQYKDHYVFENDSTLLPPKVEAALWIVAAITVVYYFDIISTFMNGDDRLRWNLLCIAFLFGTLFVTIMLYYVIYLSCFKKIDSNQWSTYNPYLIPVATVFGIISSFFVTLGVWPLYGFVTPFILGALAMGSIMISHFSPF